MAGMVTSATLANASAASTESVSVLDHVAGHELGLGDPRHGRADHPGQLQGGVGTGRPECLHPLEQAHRLEVEIGEGQFVLVDVGEPEGAPEALEQPRCSRR